MLYHQKERQVSYGEAIGILLLDSPVPFVPGDVANATTYDFPVRFRKVPGFTVEKALNRDEVIYRPLLEAAGELRAEGVRAVTGNCGFMAVHQERLKKDLGIPVFLSSLLQIPFIRTLLPGEKKIGIITASAKNLTDDFLRSAGIGTHADLIVEGLENRPEFRSAALEEKGTLDTWKIEAEVIEAAQNLVEREERVAALLLECSLLPPYASAVQTATGRPVFDYITMINYVFSALIRQPYTGFM